MLLETSDIEVIKKPFLDNIAFIDEKVPSQAALTSLALDYQFYSVVNRHFVT